MQLSGGRHSIVGYLLSVMNAAARLIFSQFDHITPLFRQIHWLKASEWIVFKFAILVYKCLHGSAPSYLVDELSSGGRRGSSATPFCLVITDRRPHSTIYRRGPSLSGCRAAHI